MKISLAVFLLLSSTQAVQLSHKSCMADSGTAPTHALAQVGCPAEFYMGPSGQCEPMSGTSAAAAAAATTCPSGMVMEGGGCVMPGTISGTATGGCPSGQILDAAGACVPGTASGTTGAHPTGGCPATGMVMDAAGVCVMPVTTSGTAGPTGGCPSGQILDAAGACVAGTASGAAVATTKAESKADLEARAKPPFFPADVGGGKGYCSNYIETTRTKRGQTMTPDGCLAALGGKCTNKYFGHSQFLKECICCGDGKFTMKKWKHDNWSTFMYAQKPPFQLADVGGGQGYCSNFPESSRTARGKTATPDGCLVALGGKCPNKYFGHSDFLKECICCGNGKFTMATWKHDNWRTFMW